MGRGVLLGVGVAVGTDVAVGLAVTEGVPRGVDATCGVSPTASPSEKVTEGTTVMTTGVEASGCAWMSASGGDDPVIGVRDGPAVPDQGVQLVVTASRSNSGRNTAIAGEAVPIREVHAWDLADSELRSPFRRRSGIIWASRLSRYGAPRAEPDPI
ncbi:MAG: hypothetical protein PVG25_13165 [Anaerolineae bacterium]